MKKILVGLALVAAFFRVNGMPPAVAVTPPQGARELFEQTLSQFHLPSGEARGAERQKLLAGAAEGYERVLKTFPTAQPWAAQAMRSLGNVRAEQGMMETAIRIYGEVEKKFPADEWEILQAWKSAGDLLWEQERAAEARVFYKKIVDHFDRHEPSALYRLIVKSSQTRLAS